jgi:carboxypeptidase Q
MSAAGVRRAVIFPVALLLSGAAAAATAPAAETTAAELRDAAMAGHNMAYAWVSELTTRFGPRPAGSANEHAAADWAVAGLQALGF